MHRCFIGLNLLGAGLPLNASGQINNVPLENCQELVQRLDVGLWSSQHHPATESGITHPRRQFA
jgi:hypothetical protein